MFMQRLITSVILIPLVLLILFYAPAWFLLALVVLVILAAGSECWQLIPVQSRPVQISFLALLLACLWLCGLVFDYWLVAGLIFWLLIIGAIISFPPSQRYWGYPLVVAIASLILLPLFAQGLMHLYHLPYGKALIVYLLCLVWAADIGAYLAGKRWGRHKLIPYVSPGKSWEGALGGLVLVLIVASIAGSYFRPTAWLNWYLLALLITVISIFGDLFISILKRRCNLKDTGALIPGHGGILDRLDSLIAAVPFFYFGIQYISFNS